MLSDQTIHTAFRFHKLNKQNPSEIFPHYLPKPYFAFNPTGQNLVIGV